MFDSIHPILNRLAPDTYGGTEMLNQATYGPETFVEWVKSLPLSGAMDTTSGLTGGRGWWILWIGFAIGHMLSSLAGLAMPYHLMAVLFIAIGYNTDEEWPDFHHGWWKARSLNEFWGKRYHQVSTRKLWGYVRERSLSPAIDIDSERPLMIDHASEWSRCLLQPTTASHTGSRYRGESS
jgi:hypothetical protein